MENYLEAIPSYFWPRTADRRPSHSFPGSFGPKTFWFEAGYTLGHENNDGE
jgi:hypothetical protein